MCAFFVWSSHHVLTKFTAHLEGECCPTSSGVILDCCEDDSVSDDVDFESIPERAKCSAYSECANLEGACCPTDEGKKTMIIFLSFFPPSSNNKHFKKMESGIFLHCCGNYLPQCTFHPKCDAEGLDGLCCPTVSNSGFMFDSGLLLASFLIDVTLYKDRQCVFGLL